jgi:hypothetical protein
MFALTESMHYYLCPGYVDMRKGIDGLYSLVRSAMHRNPVSGEVFLFVGKKRDSIKILHWENGGFVLYYKRLERGTFEIPRFDPSSGHYRMKWRTFVLIMEGVSVRSATFRKRLDISLTS